MAGAAGLRALLRNEAMVVAPGAYDGLTAKLVAQAGFAAVYMTGAGTSVSRDGQTRNGIVKWWVRD